MLYDLVLHDVACDLVSVDANDTGVLVMLRKDVHDKASVLLKLRNMTASKSEVAPRLGSIGI
jgi:hypothetical protein